MNALILTTPEDLRNLISESISKELQKFNPKVPEPQEDPIIKIDEVAAMLQIEPNKKKKKKTNNHAIKEIILKILKILLPYFMELLVKQFFES
ncbi:MAG: hypothetical protein HW421_506 [Ignavibacteria bacterium]|nr:hypothetical protein [Ignavibacteria bacterium]